jgi:hypothetical protein
LNLIRKLEIELESINGHLEDNLKDHEWLVKWKKEIETKLAKEIRRSELPETRDKKVDES